MPNDKGLLSEELAKVLEQTWYKHDSPCWYEMSQAVLSALAATPDEELLLTPEEFKDVINDAINKDKFSIGIPKPEEIRLIIGAAQLAKAKPVLLARAEKEKQEAVRAAIEAERKRVSEIIEGNYSRRGEDYPVLVLSPRIKRYLQGKV